MTLDAMDACKTHRTTAGSIAAWLRPPSYWDVTVHHLPLAMICGIALLLPYILPIEQLPRIPCTFRRLTTFPCPFCGVTRSFWAIAHGHWSEAWVNCPLAFAVFMMVAGFFFWHAAALASGVILSRGPLLRPNSKYRTAGITAAVLVLAINWAYRIGIGLDQI
ncbi:MAG: DUF2752 domain-containing protein [Desulfobacteraceae bacterium]|jgi:hypothetical protein